MTPLQLSIKEYWYYSSQWGNYSLLLNSWYSILKSIHCLSYKYTSHKKKGNRLWTIIWPNTSHKKAFKKAQLPKARFNDNLLYNNKITQQLCAKSQNYLFTQIKNTLTAKIHVLESSFATFMSDRLMSSFSYQGTGHVTPWWRHQICWQLRHTGIVLITLQAYLIYLF